MLFNVYHNVPIYINNIQLVINKQDNHLENFILCDISDINIIDNKLSV